MADTIIAATLSLNGEQAQQTVKSFKTELREANQDLVTMSRTFGETSEQALAAARRVAELRDEIGDAREVAGLFDPAARFAAFGNVVSTVAGGFSALTGTMALFGAESEDTTKVIEKLQAAMAITSGINAISDAAPAFQRLFAIIKTFSTTGIGLLITGIGLLVTAFVAFREKVEGSAIDTEDFRKELVNTSSSVAEAQNKFNVLGERIRKAGNNFEEKKSILKSYNKEFGETVGKATSINQLEKILVDTAPAYIQVLTLKARAQAAANLSLKEQEKQLQAKIDYEAKIKDIDGKTGFGFAKEEGKSIALDDLLETLTASNKTIRELSEEQAKSTAEADKLAKANKIKTEEDKTDVVKKETDKRIAIAKGETRDLLAELQEQQRAGLALRAKQLDDLIEADEKEQQQKKAAAEKENERLLDATNARIGTLNLASLNELTNFEATEKAKKDVEEQIQEQRLKTTESFLGNAAALFGKNTVAFKVAAIAQATINTYLGVADALSVKSFTIFDVVVKFANAAAILTAGIINVKKIASVQVPGGGGGGASISAGAPLAPQAPATTSTRLDSSSINQIGSATTRAYVVDYDAQNTRERQTRLARAARLSG